ncbi:MAG: aldolase [Hyphomicrobiales bacterium]|nr:MAG: aldolase [Hyphomicrobiales bacterium]
MPATRHGTCLDQDGFGVLILGQPGAGKSQLALRLIEGGFQPPFRLVADDRFLALRQEEGLTVRAPGALAGLLEVRGLGIVHLDFAPLSRAGLIVRLAARDEIERLPEFPHHHTDIEGVRLPGIDLCAEDPAAAHKIQVAVRLLRGQLSLATGAPDAG